MGNGGRAECKANADADCTGGSGPSLVGKQREGEKKKEDGKALWEPGTLKDSQQESVKVPSEGLPNRSSLAVGLLEQDLSCRQGPRSQGALGGAEDLRAPSSRWRQRLAGEVTAGERLCRSRLPRGWWWSSADEGTYWLSPGLGDVSWRGVRRRVIEMWPS